MIYTEQRTYSHDLRSVVQLPQATANLPGTAITGPTNFDNMGTDNTISLKFSDIAAPAEDAVDQYKCTFIVQFSGVTHEYSRTVGVFYS